MAKKKKDIGIVYVPVKDLIPYEKNPRKNDGAVEFVANSIKEFGFKVPCVIDTNNVVVTGHTRLKAAKKLGIKEVPCIIADDLTDEQVKAFRLADNAVGEVAGWDMDLLKVELEEIANFDLDFSMYDFAFNVNTDGLLDFGEPVYKEIEFKYQNVQKARFPGVGEYDIPELEPLPAEEYEDCEFISFGELMRTVAKENRSELGLHFYAQDSVFAGMWEDIDRYVDRLMAHKYVITPDFSVYSDFPKSLKIWNYYRNMWVGAYLQSMGQKVIPNVRNAVEGVEFMLDGMPKGGVVAYSTKGLLNNEPSRKMLLEGYDLMRKRLDPKIILWFGGFPEELKSELSDSSVKIIRKKQFTEWYLTKERYQEKQERS